MHSEYRTMADAHSKSLTVIVETPRGSRNKYKFLPDSRTFKLDRVLPPGWAFPFDFGFVPSTLAEDGDPLDVLVLTDDPIPMGCAVEVRPIGVIQATQKEGKRPVRNDRVIAVACESSVYGSWNRLNNLDDEMLLAIEQFFVSYHAVQGRRFVPMGRAGPQQAHQAIARARERASQQSLQESS
jgi:inorganic pyrophosphatase